MDNLIFGYTWEEIQRAQRGGTLGRFISLATIEEASCPLKPGDVELLETHGESGLHDLQFYGVLDRLLRAGLIQ